MENVDELTALRKAYVEVILNTVKESAARVLAAEAKAVHFEQKLKDTKDEAVSTLLRVKSNMDAKMKKENTVSFDQTRKIHDLETQLDKAKQTISCLMTELKRVNNEMEKMIPSISEKEEAQINYQNSEMKDQATHFEGALIKTKSTTNSPCSAISRHKDIPAEDGLKKTIISTSHTLDEPCCCISSASLKTKSFQESFQRNNFSESSDLASPNMSFKESVPCRNQCIQGTCGLEQNNMSYEVHQGKNKELLKNFIEEKQLNNSLSGSCLESNTVPQSNGRKRMLIGNFLSDSEIDCNSCYLSRKPKRRVKSSMDKCAAGNESSRISINSDEPVEECRNSLTGQSMEKCNMLLLRCGTAYSNNHSVKNELLIFDTKSDFCQDKPSEVGRNQGLPDESVMGNTIATANSVQRGESLIFANSSDGLYSNVKMETADVPVDNDEMNHTSTGLKCKSTKATTERHLKYTFQRKRIKGIAVNTSENILPEKQITLKRKAHNIGSPSPSPSPPPHCEKSCLAKEFSRKSHRIAQVARQLISLSEKK